MQSRSYTHCSYFIRQWHNNSL